MKSLSTRQIIGGFNRREARAQNLVCRKYFPYVFGIVEEISGHSPETKDLVEDVFMKLLENRGPFKNLNAVKYFLYTAARNMCLNYLRRRKHPVVGMDEIEPGNPRFTDNSLEEAESLAGIWSVTYCAIRRLPPQQQQVVLLSYMEGMTNEAIAAQLGIAEKTVANMKTIALKALRAEMPEIKRRFLLLLLYLLP